MISIVLSLLAGAATPPPPPLVSESSQPVVYRPAPPTAPLPPLADFVVPEVRAKANLPSLFSTDDYPAAARRADEQGTVAIDAAVDPIGRVIGCNVTTSSGSPSLDATTCSIIQRRARFTPAQDGAGRAVADRVQARIRWVLPPARPIPFADYRLALVFRTDAAGLIAGCRVESSMETPKDNRPCSSTMDEARLVSVAMAKRFAVANREVVLEQGLLVGGTDRARGIGRRSGETFGEMLVLALKFDADGAVVECAGAYGDENPQRVASVCADTRKRKVLPTDNPAANPTRRAVRYFASYTRPIG